jgi:DNA-binding transcriptional MerR regulator
LADRAESRSAIPQASQGCGVLALATNLLLRKYAIADAAQDRNQAMNAVGQSSEYYSISDLTREFGVSTRTIRFYEDEALIKPVRKGRTRLFRPSDRRLLSMILRGKRLGFSIAEIREILNMYKAPTGEEGQMRLLLKRVGEKRAELEQKRRDIEETLRELDSIDDQVMARLAELGVSR